MFNLPAPNFACEIRQAASLTLFNSCLKLESLLIFNTLFDFYLSALATLQIFFVFVFMLFDPSVICIVNCIAFSIKHFITLLKPS